MWLGPVWYSIPGSMGWPGRFELGPITTVLIPKNINPTHMWDFHPISICNVLYELISKVLANSFPPSKMHFPEQSTFVEDRSILDNVMLTCEIVHHMKCKFSLKIDISKALSRLKILFLFFWKNWVSMRSGLIGEIYVFRIIFNYDQ